MGNFRCVVIPVAVEASNPTLPLAIESIRTHTDYDVVTMGHDHGLAEHVNVNQSPHPQHRWANTDAIMRAACERFDQFIWSADDIYWTRPAEPVKWALGDLSNTLRRGAHGRRKQATCTWLMEHGVPTWDYESHTPMPIESGPMLDVLAIVKAEPLLDKRTLYGNMTGRPDLVAPDVKVRDVIVPDTPWVSSAGTAYIAEITSVVLGTPNASRT